MRATMYGCEIVCSCPIGSAASEYARRRSPSGTNSSRGTRPIASTTCRRSGGIGVGGELHAVVLERERRQVDDPARLGLEADGQQRDEGVARLERAVTAAAEVAAAGQISQLDPERRRDEQLAGIG